MLKSNLVSVPDPFPILNLTPCVEAMYDIILHHTNMAHKTEIAIKMQLKGLNSFFSLL